MDDIDRQLIALLRDDARTPCATLAKRLRVARGTVQNRLARLEREARERAASERLEELKRRMRG